MREKHKRSLAKATTWRIIASVTTMSLVYLFTGELELTATVGVFDITLKMLFYYLHERAWNKTLWGKELHYKEV
ncbi:DUF2061 domain-containing protein [Patescibacteria group bacterium]|nr:DUF2061 domain-containing protein [Patescibacteria group bacterium]